MNSVDLKSHLHARLADPGDGPMPRILVLDDQFAIRSLFDEVLSANEYEVFLARDLGEARELIRTHEFDTVIVDIFLAEDQSGLDLMPLVRQYQPLTPIIVISGMASTDNVIEALKAGAYDMLTKPFNIIDMLHVVARGIEKKRLAMDNERLLGALRLERDSLEARVNEATRDLQEKIAALHTLNDQISTMFEMSQTAVGEGSSPELMQRIFDLLRRVIEFEGAFCVVYDVRAKGVNLTYADGQSAQLALEHMTDMLVSDRAGLVYMAESADRVDVDQLEARIWELFPNGQRRDELTLMPLHVHRTLIGVLGLVRPEGSPHMTGDHERILGLAISHILAMLEQRNFIARSAQLASLGELIAEIAHDLRNPMTSLRGASKMLVDGWAQEAKRRRCLEEITGNLARMESLVSELVTFYNPKEMNIQPIDLTELMEKSLQVTRGLLDQKRIEVVRRYPIESATVMGLDRNLIEAFVNLIGNACQAMAEGGTLTITIEAHVTDEHPGAGRALRQHPSGYIMVAVADTGCGIPEELRSRIFKRFFTTKPEGHGLGLSAVQRVVKKNLGHIHVDSETGVGTTFFVYLPRA